MSDDFLIVTSLDQPLEVDDREVLERAEEIIRRAIEQHNAYVALVPCRELIKASKLSGMALAKILYLIRENWDEFEIDDTFEDVGYEFIGLHRDTVTRYVQVWNMYASKQIPEKFEEAIRQRNIKEQIPIAKVIARGGEIDDDEWEELAYAPDLATVGKIVRDIEGRPPRKTSLQIYMDSDGSLWAYQAGQRGFVGSLEIDSDEEIVLKAIERLTKGVMRR